MTDTGPAAVAHMRAVGEPFHVKPAWLPTTLRDSEAVAAVPATLNAEGEPGVAIFGDSPGPRITLNREAAERLADELDEILAKFEEGD